MQMEIVSSLPSETVQFQSCCTSSELQQSFALYDQLYYKHEHCTMDQLYYKHKQASDTLKAWTDDVATSCKHNVRTSIMLTQIGRKCNGGRSQHRSTRPGRTFWVREIPTTDVIRHEWHEASDVPI